MSRTSRISQSEARVVSIPPLPPRPQGIVPTPFYNWAIAAKEGAPRLEVIRARGKYSFDFCDFPPECPPKGKRRKWYAKKGEALTIGKQLVAEAYSVWAEGHHGWWDRV